MNRCVVEKRGGGGMEEGSRTVERSRSEGEMAMRLIQAVSPAIWGRGDVWPQLPQRAASGSVVLPYLGSVVMSVAGCVIIEGLAGAWDLGHHLRPHWCSRAMLSLGSY